MQKIPDIKPEKSTLPLLSIILPSLNSKRYYQACLGSLLKINYPNYEVIIVDDGSTDGSFEEIKKLSLKNPKLKVIQTLNRKGIPASRNIGIEVAGGDLIAFFDMDMEVTSTWPMELIKVLLNQKDVGAVLPKVLDFHQRNIIQSVGGRIIPYSAWVLVRGFGEVDKGQYQKPEEISVNAAGVIIRKEAVRQLEGYDEDLGMFDDLDFGWRLWVIGWRSLYVPNSEIFHWTIKPNRLRHAGASSLIHEYYQANVIRMMLKNLETKNLIRYLPIAILIQFIRVLLNLFKGNINTFLGMIRSYFVTIVELPKILKQRSMVQTKRQFSDSRLWDAAFVKGNIFSVYYRTFRGNIETSRIWHIQGKVNSN